MRTITTTTNVYKFEELSPESQANALDKYREWMTDDPYWYTCETEYHKDLLTEQGIIKPEIYFSGFWNQGDGAVFECKGFDLYVFINKVVKPLSPYLYDLWCNDQLDLDFHIVNLHSHSSHERTAKFEIRDWNFYEDDDDPLPNFDKTNDEVAQQVEELEKDLEQWRLDTCREIYKALEDEFTLLQSDDVLKEHFVENEYEFTEDGEMYNE